MSNLRWNLLLIGALAVLAGGCGKPEPEAAPEPYEADLVNAVAHLERGETADALALLQTVVEHAPSNAIAQLNLGVAREQAGLLPEAVDAYVEAAALNTDDARPLELAARLFMQVDDWDGARRMLDQANRREEYSPRILTTMGVVEYRAGNLDMAEAFFGEALEADAAYSSALYNAAVLQRDGRKDLERAVGFFEAYLECAVEDDPRLAAIREFVASHRSTPESPAPDPEPPAPHSPKGDEESPAAAAEPVDNSANRLWTRALNAHHQGDTARAMELYKAALELDPEIFGAWHNLGLAARTEGELAVAGKAFDRALALRPDSTDSRFMLAVVKHEEGDDDMAVQFLDNLLTIQPRHIKANYLLAVIYANAGRRGMARTHFEHVLRLDGTGEFGQQASDWLKANERESPPKPTR